MGTQIIFLESGRGLGHVTSTIFGVRSNISPKLLDLETLNLVGGFVWAMPSRRTNNFPESRRGLGHVTPTIFGSTGGSSDSLASCNINNDNGDVDKSLDHTRQQQKMHTYQGSDLLNEIVSHRR